MKTSILSRRADPCGFCGALLIAMVLCSGCSGTVDPKPDPGIALPHRGAEESDAGHGCIDCPQDVPHLQSEGSKSLDYPGSTNTSLGPKG